MEDDEQPIPKGSHLPIFDKKQRGKGEKKKASQI